MHAHHGNDETHPHKATSTSAGGGRGGITYYNMDARASAMNVGTKSLGGAGDGTDRSPARPADDDNAHLEMATLRLPDRTLSVPAYPGVNTPQ